MAVKGIGGKQKPSFVSSSASDCAKFSIHSCHGFGDGSEKCGFKEFE